MACPSSKLYPHGFIGGFTLVAIACLHGNADQQSGSGRPNRTPNAHRAVAGGDRLRHQIAVLERSRTRRPYFRRIDRLFWILLSRWWPQWRESLMIVQPETVLRWRRNGWLAFWRYRSSGRWRGGRPRISGEVRNLIRQMALENFLWGAPRIHGELLMLGYTVSQATVSRYLPAPAMRNQASAFGQYSETRSRGCAGLQVRPYWAKLMRSATAKVATVSVELRRGLSRQPSAPNARRIGLRSARRELAAMHRVPRLAAVYGGLQQPRSSPPPIAVAVRSPPSEARASPKSRSRANQPVAFLVDQVLRSHSDTRTPVSVRSTRSTKASRAAPASTSDCRRSLHTAAAWKSDGNRLSARPIA
jgi:hypothetical protein